MIRTRIREFRARYDMSQEELAFLDLVANG